jgi:hypothetical protein
MTTGRPVTEAELLAHVGSWPRPLKRDVYGAYEPPLVTYNDFSFGNWPSSIVCFYHASGYDCPPSHWTIVRELPE